MHKNTQIPLRILPGTSTYCTLSQVETSIWLGAAYPQQAFQLLCLTAGACKIEYLLQTMSSPNLTQQLADLCSSNLRATYASILQVPRIDDFKWTHAAIPRRMGGFGLRDPRAIIQSARLASLTNVSELAHSLGASHRYVQNEASKATSAYMAAVQSDIHPQLTPLRDLQRWLTQPLHQAMLASLINLPRRMHLPGCPPHRIYHL